MYERTREHLYERQGALIVGFLAGGLTGAAIALLLAPHSGEATRNRINRTLRDTADGATHLTERLKKRGEGLADEGARRVSEASSALGGHAPRTERGHGDDALAT